MKTNNNFQISGFVVNDATINQFAMGRYYFLYTPPETVPGS